MFIFDLEKNCELKGNFKNTLKFGKSSKSLTIKAFQNNDANRLSSSVEMYG